MAPFSASENTPDFSVLGFSKNGRNPALPGSYKLQILNERLVIERDRSRQSHTEVKVEGNHEKFKSSEVSITDSPGEAAMILREGTRGGDRGRERTKPLGCPLACSGLQGEQASGGSPAPPESDRLTWRAGGGLHRSGPSYRVPGAGGCGGAAQLQTSEPDPEAVSGFRGRDEKGRGGRPRAKKAAGERRRREQQGLVFLTWHVCKALC